MNSSRGISLTSLFFFRPSRRSTLPRSSLWTPQLWTQHTAVPFRHVISHSAYRTCFCFAGIRAKDLIWAWYVLFTGTFAQVFWTLVSPQLLSAAPSPTPWSSDVLPHLRPCLGYSPDTQTPRGFPSGAEDTKWVSGYCCYLATLGTSTHWSMDRPCPRDWGRRPTPGSVSCSPPDSALYVGLNLLPPSYWGLPLRPIRPVETQHSKLSDNIRHS